MQKYLCEPCGYVYGTAFEDIPDDWVCPICGMGKEVFIVEE